MKNRIMTTEAVPGQPVGPELERLLATVRDRCIDCPKCMAQCAFLKKYGSPKHIAAAYDPDDPVWLNLAFECSLCDLCAAVCPVNVDPGALFLEMRREAVDRGAAPLPAHKGILAYEARGISKRYSWYSLPEDCTTAFFPGCTFSGTRMDTAIALYEYLKGRDPQTGIVLDCCCKPSHDLGRSDFFKEAFDDLKSWLAGYGVHTVIVTCPNCYTVFKRYGEGLSVRSVYEILAETGLPQPLDPDVAALPMEPACIHDPCVLRNENGIQSAVRFLAGAAGYVIEEMPHTLKQSLCCGEGGAVGPVAPELADGWTNLLKQEANGRHLLTCCAGCAGLLCKTTPTDHILDAVFFPKQVATGNRKTTKAPMTYVNRIRLKRYIRKNHPAPIGAERDFTPESRGLKKRGGNAVKIILLLAIVASIAAIRLTGIHEHLDSETLRQTVASLGSLGPLAYMLLYAIAPALFLPGLPLTLAGGILFGPVWGVVYAITGATAGASLAFLISRYMARDWVRAKLSGPKWRRLEQGVEKNGWKIVAFTRLAPVFPFNLLNYAFGLTAIGFFPYAVTSFVCMLPACIAFIVFSSSFMDLLKGKVSPALIAGAVLIVLVSLIPVLIRKIKSAI
jgi:uncharacterized membrane protein YdjX (TVP38/TMEM64 family)/Fe-S oxidoreductase